MKLIVKEIEDAAKNYEAEWEKNFIKQLEGFSSTYIKNAFTDGAQWCLKFQSACKQKHSLCEGDAELLKVMQTLGITHFLYSLMELTIEAYEQIKESKGESHDFALDTLLKWNKEFTQLYSECEYSGVENFYGVIREFVSRKLMDV